jgi:hypothetical protein
MPVFPFFILFPLLLLGLIKSTKIRYVFMGIFCVVFALNSLNLNKMEYVYKNKPDEYRFRQNTSLPVFVIGVGNHPLLVPYYDDSQIYIFDDSDDSFDNLIDDHEFDKFYVVAYKDSFEKIKTVIDTKNFIINSEFDCGYYSNNTNDNDCFFSALECTRQ